MLYGCAVTYGDYTSNQYTQIQPNDCSEKASSIYLFYEGEQLDFDYVKIGEVETEGEEYARNSEVLDYIKYEAWRNCANGLINIRDGYKDREQGYLFDFDSDSEEIYSSKYYHAIAVKIKVDSIFLEKYGNGVDTSFISNVEKYKEEQDKRTSNQFAASFIGGILGVILILIAASGS